MIKGYKCAFCDFFGSKAVVADHEKTCINNPNYKCCANCAYFSHAMSVFLSSYDNYGHKPNPVCTYDEDWEKLEFSKKMNIAISRKQTMATEHSYCEHWQRKTDYKVNYESENTLIASDDQ